jgi:hypothetical protein
MRWIFPGPLSTGVMRWFSRFPAATESREDLYLLDPLLRGLSVKIRGGGALEVKAYGGNPGILDVAGRARGYLEFWQKWSFPFSPGSPFGPFSSFSPGSPGSPGDPGSADPPGWRAVRKSRRISRFSHSGGQIEARGPGPRQGRDAPDGLQALEEPRCEVELTEVRVLDEDSWTLGFEATGPASVLRSELEATAALVFADALPDGLKPGPDESRSYAEWLGQRPRPDNDREF